MNFRDAIADLERLYPDALLCVRKPWSATAECVVTAPSPDGGVPKAIKDAGFEYLIGVPSALEALEVLNGAMVTVENQVRLLLYYGEFDAYPDWVYGR